MTHELYESFSDSPPNASYIFLFAHQDDELFAYPLFRYLIYHDLSFHIYYLTSGSSPSAKIQSLTRQYETLLYFKKLGVKSHHIKFIGCQLGINDGELHLNLSNVFVTLRNSIGSHYVPNATLTFVTHAFEGGHPDHDSCYCISHKLVSESLYHSRLLSIPYYRASSFHSYLYRVFAPLKSNGSFIRFPFRRRYIFQFLVLSSIYKSQFISMIMLLPFAVLHILVFGYIPIHHTLSQTLPLRPTNGKTFSESRFKLNWSSFVKYCRDFLVS